MDSCKRTFNLPYSFFFWDNEKEHFIETIT
jgi:hypothetical protein